jgi:hypothetical protein
MPVKAVVRYQLLMLAEAYSGLNDREMGNYPRMRPGKRSVRVLRQVSVNWEEVLGLGVLCLAVSAFLQ